MRSLKSGAVVEKAILDKRVIVGKDARVGSAASTPESGLVMIGKSSVLPQGLVAEPGCAIGPDVIPTDFRELRIRTGQFIQTRRLPNEV